MESSGGCGGGLTGILWLAAAIATIAGWWKLFEKAGKPGWAAIIPIYNLWIIIEICGKPWWWLLVILLVPIVNIVLAIMLLAEFVKKFGQPGWHALLLIFVGFVYAPWLGFGPATYRG